jgi:DNA polymerase-3 subunit beta
MKLSCNTSELLESLHLASRAIGSQQALPILGNILFEVKGNVCTLSATDLELSVVTSFSGTVESEGAITVPAKAIVNFAQYNNDPEVTLEVIDGTQLKCTSAHAKTMIAGESANDYPTISKVETENSFTLDAAPLLRALHLVTFASAKTSLRPVLSGVYISREKGKLVLVATDSYRLSEYTIEGDGTGEDFTCIVPAKILEELKSVLSGKKGEKKPGEGEVENDSTKVEVLLGKQQIELRAGRVRLLSRLIEGKFPNYNQIIPKEVKTKAVFATNEFTVSVKRLHYFAKEINNNLTFNLNGNTAKISTPQTQIGKDEAELSVEVSGEEGKIALSSSFLLDFLSHMSSDAFEMQMTDAMHPAVFRLAEDPAFLHLIMPLRMQD